MIESLKRLPPRLGSVVLFMALVLAAPALAAGPSPIPPFSADGVSVDPSVRADFDELRTFLAEFESKAGARYHACVVPISERRGRAGRQYSGSAIARVDEVFEEWREHLDPGQHVLILIALRNRGVAVHPGSEWARRGFENNRITRVIDRSAFKVNARAGNYDRALVELVRSIDAHLAGLAAAEKRLIDKTAARLPALEKRIERLWSEVNAAAFVLSSSEDLLTRAEEAADRSRLDLEAGQPARADKAADTVAARLSELDRALTRGQALWKGLPGRLTEAESELAKLESRLDAAPYQARSVASMLAVGAGTLESVATTRAQPADPFALDAQLSGAEQQLARASERLDDADRSHHFRTVVLPRAAGVILLAAALIIVWALRRRRQEHLEVTMEEIDRWDSSLDLAATRLLALEDDHPLLFGATNLSERFTGKTAEQFQLMAEGVDTLFLGHARARMLLEEARALVASAGPLSARRIDEAREILTTREVEVGRERLKGVHLFLPDTRIATRPGAALLTDLASGYESSVQHVADMEDLLRRLPELRHELLGHLAAIETQLHDLAQDHDVAALHREHAALGERRLPLAEMADPDPLQSEPWLMQLRDDAAALLARLTTIRDAVSVLARLETDTVPAIRERLLAIERDEGFAVGEPGFEPAAMLHAIERLGRECRRALTAANAEDCSGKSEAAAATVGELDELIEATLSSRAGSGARLTALEQRAAELSPNLRTISLFQLRLGV
ncbi:MAG: TPM domain-containing protein [Acidobacteriota bacterium]